MNVKMNVKMGNNENNSILFGNPNNRSRQTENPHQYDKKQKKEGAIYAGDLNLNQDEITMKKVEAHKKAMKTVFDEHANELKTDGHLESIREHINELKAQAMEAQKEISDIQDKKSQLKEAYGITDDSEMDNLNNSGALKDYQEAVLEYDDMEAEWQKRIDTADKGIEAGMGAIQGIELARLKTHPMVNAQNEAKDIIEAASKEIVGMLIKETKDHVDEEIKEKEEADKKAEEEKKLEKEKENQGTVAKENETSEDSSIDNQQLNQITKADMNQDKLQKEVKILLNNKKIIEEDLKGILLDEQM